MKTAVSKTLFFLFLSCIFLASCSDKKIQNTEQRAYLTPDVMCGTVQFRDGCSPKLDTLIRFGIALIHHMTYEDAEYTFSKVIEQDKDCFWGYWGKAMSLVHPLWPDAPNKKILEQGFVLTQNALKLAKNKKEKLYGEAIAAFFRNDINKTKPQRLIAFNNGWQQARKELPEDIEAKMFSVLSMLSVVDPTDKTYKIQREAGAIAEEVLKKYPDHPAAFHYAIHAYDVPALANNAVRVARDYYKIAPKIPHALHMPTHIFTRLGLWRESINLNSRSAEVAKKIPVNGQISAQYFHAMDYMVYAYLQLSDFQKAKQIANTVENLEGVYEPSPITAYALAAIPARVALEMHNWKDATNLQIKNYPKFPWKNVPQYEALLYFAKGVGAGRNNNTQVAMQSLNKLEELQKKFKNPEADKYWINQIEIQKVGVKAWLLFAQGEKDKALETMKQAANLEDATEKNPVTPGPLLPAREMLGDLLLEMNRPDEAFTQYEMSLKNSPNRLNSLTGAGKSAGLSGNKEKAAYYYNEMKKISKSNENKNDQLSYVVE